MDDYKLKKRKNCILIVDDDRINREILKKIFSDEYCFEEAANGCEGLEKIKTMQEKLCAIILDVQMPKMTGMDVLRTINKMGITEKIPVFLITMHDDMEIVKEAYTLGVMDYLNKPVTPVIIHRRVESVIELFQTREVLSATVKGQEEKLIENARTIEELHRSTLETLAAAIEFRDVESGHHTNRIYEMTKYILYKTDMGIGFSDDDIENIARASIMHDVGKIAISDMILNKPAKLTKEEFKIMKLHTVKGGELLKQISRTQSHDLYKFSCDIARHHHERWDGKGYPDGLKGNEISIPAQVVSIVDVYDALVSERVYKKSFDPDVAVDMIKKGECGAFNPKLLKCFLQVEPAIRTWYKNGESPTFHQDIDTDIEHSSAENAERSYVTSELSNVMLLMAAAKYAFDLIIFVNLSKNTYYMVDYERFLNHTQRADGVFDTLIEDAATTIPEPYKNQFSETFFRKPILQAFKEGRRSLSLNHKQMGDDGNMHWMSTTGLVMENTCNGDILEVILSRCIDSEMEHIDKSRKFFENIKISEICKPGCISKIKSQILPAVSDINAMSGTIFRNLDNHELIKDCAEKIGFSSKLLQQFFSEVSIQSDSESNN